MGSSDIPPPGPPTWLIPLSTFTLGLGVTFWLIAYVLMTRRSLSTRSPPVPLIPLGLNLGWEVVYAFYVSEARLEVLGFAAWFVLDIPVLYATITTSASPPSAARTLALWTAISLVANYAFAAWWLSSPHRSLADGDKTGKMWAGMDGRDCTELAFWSAGVAQAAFSIGALVTLLQRGHDGGQSHAIWTLGTVMGLPVTSVLLWCYWPEAHGYVCHPAAWAMLVPALLCDAVYPIVLERVRMKGKRKDT